jgi:hypothetical protein
LRVNRLLIPLKDDALFHHEINVEEFVDIAGRVAADGDDIGERASKPGRLLQ